MTLRAYPDGEWVAATRGLITELPEVTRQLRQDRGAITVVDGSGRNRVGGTAMTSAGVQ
jgi:hypothetical protein